MLFLLFIIGIRLDLEKSVNLVLFVSFLFEPLDRLCYLTSCIHIWIGPYSQKPP